MKILVPTSPGDLLDKISILTIKADRLEGQKRTHALNELRLLSAIAEAELRISGLEELLQELRDVNLALWDAEDRLRDFERSSEFGPSFVACARSIYRNNDKRFFLKRRLNELLGSSLLEEKSYA